MNITARYTSDPNEIELSINGFVYTQNRSDTLNFDICEHILNQQREIDRLKLKLAQSYCRSAENLSGGMGA